MGDIGLALQNWPKAMCRMVVAPDGWLLAGLDYSQLEYRCIALLAGEESLLDIFNDETGHRDLHSENAARLWAHAWSSCDPETANSPYQENEFRKRRNLLRFLTKTGLYASLYGASADTVRKQLRASSFRESDPDFARILREITLETCQMFVDAVPRLWPRIAQWREKAVRDVQKELRIVCPLSGRRRVWPLGMVDYTQAVNNRVQTLAAAIMNERFISLCDCLPSHAYPILQVHDSVVVESPEQHADDVLRLMEETMRTSIELGGFHCRFDVEGAVAKSWDQV
jgi:DNA polymerase-1